MSAATPFASLVNSAACDTRALPLLAIDEFSRSVIAHYERGARVSAFFAGPATDGNELELFAVIADDAQGRLHVARAALGGDAFPSLTPPCPQVHLFEREIAEQWGLTPAGHPWLKPVRFHGSFPAGRGQLRGFGGAVGVMDFYRVQGEQVHEVAVGPVHAGVIEPGHFRFQCHGEDVFHLEISLGYQHRGIERALVGGPDKKTIHYMETAAGDTTVAHTTAYCQVIEALSGCAVPARAQALRGVALELERLANHVGDLGALANDVGFLPTASYCGRIRGDLLNMTALVCGSRFGRGLVRPGGVGFDLDPAMVEELRKRLASAQKDTTVAVNLLWDTPTVMARFEDVGVVSPQVCRELGLVGPSARACGAGRDVRHDHPSGIFRFSQVSTSTWDSGDVFARAYVRWLEVQRSIQFIEESLASLPAGPVMAEVARPAAHRLAIALVEGWRGEVCHVAMTDERGKFARYKIVDPSFHNWAGLAMALRNQQISDFPLCNKSFNLSYCGFDL